MKLLTIRTQIREVAERWREQYQPFDLKQNSEIYDQLLALDVETATAEDVAKIIGNDSWTDLKCHECRKHDLPEVVQAGEEPDYESATANLCRDCLTKAFKLLP